MQMDKWHTKKKAKSRRYLGITLKVSIYILYFGSIKIYLKLHFAFIFLCFCFAMRDNIAISIINPSGEYFLNFLKFL